MPETQPITKEDLTESFKEFRKEIKKDINEAIDERVPKILEREMPFILGQFTDGVLLPSITTLIRQEIAQAEHRLKAYVDSKIAELRGDRELFRKFMVKTVEILRRHRVASEEEIGELSRLIPV